MPKNRFGPSQPCSVAVQFNGQSKLYSIPSDLTIESLIISLRKVFGIDEKFAIYLTVKGAKKLLNCLIKLSQLLLEVPLMDELESLMGDDKQDVWNKGKQSYQYLEKGGKQGRRMLKLNMQALETFG